MPETAWDYFYARINGILAGEDAHFTPANSNATDEANLIFDAIVDDALAYAHLTIVVPSSRKQKYCNSASVLCCKS